MPKLIGNKYYTLITDIGEAKIANNLYSGKKIDFALLKLGNGNDEEYNPDSSQTDLRKEVWRGNVVHVEIDKKNPNWINIYTVIPPGDGGFWIREMGVFDSDGDMIAICNVAPSYKPTLDEGSAKEITMKMTMAVTNTSVITLKVDPTVIYAKRKDVISLQTRVNDITAQLNDMMYEVAGGTATAITLNMPATLKDGYWKKFIASKDNGGAATTINEKSFYKVCSTNPPNLKKDRPYEAYYNATNDCFFLKASATGTTSADKVLAGETFSTENDTDLVGTMPNRGAVTATLNAGGSYTIPAGYHNGSGKVTANSLKSQTSANATASDIISGKTAWVNGSKLTGTATIQSLGGSIVQTGSFTVDSSYSTKSFKTTCGESTFTFKSLTFNSIPKFIIVYYYGTGTTGSSKIESKVALYSKTAFHNSIKMITWWHYNVNSTSSSDSQMREYILSSSTNSDVVSSDEKTIIIPLQGASTGNTYKYIAFC